MKKKRKGALFMVLLLTVLAALGGCKGSTAPEEEGKTLAEGSISYGGSIIVGITQDLDSLDPHKAVAAGTKEVLYNIFEGLVKPDKDGNLISAVASDYSISEDGMFYRFTLRQGLTFHNGEPVTAEDVIYSLKRCAGMLKTSDPEVQVISAFSVISDIREEDGVIEVKLSDPNTELIGYFTCSIIPENYDKQATAPVGTGPFRFVSYEPFEKFVMEKNETYYLEGVPYLDQVTFKISGNTDAAFLELLGGNIDIFPYLTEEQAAQLEGKARIEYGEMSLVQALFLNNAAPPFDDPLVRQALCHAVDRQMVMDMLSGGRGRMVGSAMFANFKKYYDESLENTYPYDPEKAKQLLADAGYPDGFRFTITVPSNYQYHVDTAQVIVEQLKQVGINADIKLVEWASWLSDIYKGRNFDATIVGLDAQLAPSDVLRFYPSDSGRNFINYKNAAFDETYKKAGATINEAEKITYYKQLQELLTEDAASVFIQCPALLVAVNPKLGGYTFYPVYVQDMSTVYWSK